MSCHLVLQLLLWDLDGVVLDAVAVPLVRHLLGHQLLEDEEQQLVVVSAEGQVAGERLMETDDSDLVNVCASHTPQIHMFTANTNHINLHFTKLCTYNLLLHSLTQQAVSLTHRFMDV